MALSWNEIKDRAVKFSKDWANAASKPEGFLNNPSGSEYLNIRLSTSPYCFKKLPVL